MDRKQSSAWSVHGDQVETRRRPAPNPLFVHRDDPQATTAACDARYGRPSDVLDDLHRVLAAAVKSNGEELIPGRATKGYPCSPCWV